MADWRDKFYGQHYAKKTKKIDPNIAECKAILHEDYSLLDVGCNIGSLYESLGHKNYEGIDLDPKAIEEARRRFPEGRFSVGDLYDIDGEWDVVLVSRVLMHVAPLDLAMKKLMESAKKYLVLFVPIAEEDSCELHGHDRGEEKLYSYFRRFSEKTLSDFGRCSITRREPYSTVIYGQCISER